MRHLNNPQSLHKLLALISLCTLLDCPQAWAWNGVVSGEVSVNKTTSPSLSDGLTVTGSARVSDEDGLSLIGTLSVPQRRGLSTLSVRVKRELLDQTLSFPGEGRLVTYQERGSDGRLSLSASAYQGWISVSVADDKVTLRFELSVREGGEVRSLASGGARPLIIKSLIRELAEGDEALAVTGDVVIASIEESADEGCDEPIELDDEDVYETESEDVGCDMESDDWSEELDSSSASDESESSSCEEDEWAAEASTTGARRGRSRPYSRLVRLTLRLAPLWCSLLMVRLWRRRALLRRPDKRREPHQAPPR